MKHKLKQNTNSITKYESGDFIIFRHNNKNCIGCIVEYRIWSEELGDYFFQNVINYIDEMGIMSSVQYDDIQLHQKVLGIKIKNTFKELETNEIFDAIPSLINTFELTDEKLYSN